MLMVVVASPTFWFSRCVTSATTLHHLWDSFEHLDDPCGYRASEYTNHRASDRIAAK